MELGSPIQKRRTDESIRDDSVLLITRIVSALIVPFLLAAFVILYILPLPESTTRYFAWTIRPPMTPMLMGAGYVAGAYFFARAATSRRWHHVSVGFPGVAAFASFMAIATILHWDRFNHGSTALFIWVALYAVTPFLIPALWVANRRTDPGTPDGSGAKLPEPVRLVIVVAGVFALAVALSLLFAPTSLASIWPWMLSPLTARVGAAWFALFGATAAGFAFERRWSAARVLFQTLAFALVLNLIAVGRAWDDFNKGNPLTWLFLLGLIAGLAGITVLYAAMHRRSVR